MFDSVQHKWEEKAWGRVIHPAVGLSCLEVQAGHESSCHCHEKKANLFIVLRGALRIVEWCECGQTTSVVLHPGESYAVPPGVYHQFRVIESGVVVEYYSVDGDRRGASQDDIIRRQNHPGVTA